VEAHRMVRRRGSRWRWGCQLYAPTELHHQESFWYSFLLKAEVMVQMERLGNWRNPMTPLEIETVPLRLAHDTLPNYCAACHRRAKYPQELCMYIPLWHCVLQFMTISHFFMAPSVVYWLQIQRSVFDSLSYQIFWEVVGLEQGPISLMSRI
jgi:hypothetical protein